MDRRAASEGACGAESEAGGRMAAVRTHGVVTGIESLVMTRAMVAPFPLLASA